VQNIRHVSKCVAILRNVVKIIVSVALLGNSAFQFSILFFSAATKVTSETITNTNLLFCNKKEENKQIL